MDPLTQYAAGLNEAQVSYVVIGVWGAGYYTRGSVFLTEDQDLFLPRDPQNLLTAWEVAQSMGLQLRSGQGPLDEPRDEQLARAVVDRRALTRGNARRRVSQAAGQRFVAPVRSRGTALARQGEIIESRQG